MYTQRTSADVVQKLKQFLVSLTGAYLKQAKEVKQLPVALREGVIDMLDGQMFELPRPTAI